MKTCVRWGMVFVWVVFLLNGCSSRPPAVHLKQVHQQFVSARSTLEQAEALLPADSVIIMQERIRLEKQYRHFADSLKQYAPDSVYARFAMDHFLSMAYAARTIKELLPWQDSLITLVAAYPQTLEYRRTNANEIARCIVNSLEGTEITSEKELLRYAEKAVEEIFRKVYHGKATPEQKREVIDRYAVQYAGRGIISMAEPFYTHFASLYKKPEKKAKPIRFSKDYQLYEKNNRPVVKLSKLNSSWRFMAFNIKKTNFNLVFLISAIRAGIALNPGIPFIIARNPGQLNNKVIYGIGRNISGEFGYLNLNTADSTYYSHAPSFVVVMPNGKIDYFTNNAIDFLQWLRAPLAKQKAEAEKKRLENQRMLEAKRKRLATMPPDTSVKQIKKFRHTKVILKGYWPQDAQISIKSFYFGDTVLYKDRQYNISEVSILQKGRLLHNQWVIRLSSEKNITLTLLSNKKHSITTTFSDSVNSLCLRKMKTLEQDQNMLKRYKQIISHYPFKNSGFVAKLTIQKQQVQQDIDSLLKNSVSNKVLGSVLGISEVFYKLKNEPAPTNLDYPHFMHMMSMPCFDTILYRSPFYGPVIKQWLTYGSADLQTAIDLLFSSSKWIPENHKSMAMQYVWKQMNALGREDMMAYIDTTYLAGCSAENSDVQKRIEGYKRMAPGQKAPDIHWIENGKKMDLYHVKADSIYVVFWADWCGHCKKFIPRFYQQVKKQKGVFVIAVAVDHDSSTLKLGRQIFPAWHHLWASGMWNDPLVQKYNVFATPTLYLLNKDKVILRKLSGD